MLCLGLAWINACTPAAEKAVTPVGLPGEDLSRLAYADIAGSETQYARQIDSTTGAVQIEGFMKNGKKTGMWIQYTPEGDIQLINHYVDGQLEGVALRMTFRNQVDLRSTYRRGKLDGPYTAYRFGKIVEERMYKDGMLHGPYKIYDDRTFKIKQDMNYANDKLDGLFRYYNEEGAVTVEYTYKNGEKVGGGMTEPAQ
jgi:antitoxin component YwqK of YwqJK toxin-antitoxin module